MMKAAVVGVAAVLAGSAVGQTGTASATFNVSGPVSVAADVTLFGQESASTTFSGPLTVSVSLVDGLVTAVQITDFLLSAADDVTISDSVFLIGNYSATASGLTVDLVVPGGPTAITPPATSATFDQTGNAIALQGSLSYRVVALGTEEEGVFDLTELEASTADTTGASFTLDVGAGTISVSAPIAYSTELSASGLTVDLSVAGTLGGSGPIELPTACTPDINRDGVLNIFDILGYFDLFSVNDAGADLTGDGQYDVFDIIRFFDLFGQGC